MDFPRVEVKAYLLKHIYTGIRFGYVATAEKHGTNRFTVYGSKFKVTEPQGARILNREP